uniref:CutA divalent cation tolerance homolog n=1 Tax=Gopherus evgoodei TaxID=1825980 RepID=A0A8C5F0Y9_9SAUR
AEPGAGRSCSVCLCPRSVLLLSLLMVSLLRTVYQRFSSMAAEAYTPGSLSAAFVTCPNEKVGKEIARAMVEKHLAACVNIMPQITSIYEWKGKIEEDREVLLMIKTRSSQIPALTDFVRSVHCHSALGSCHLLVLCPHSALDSPTVAGCLKLCPPPITLL